MTEHHTYPLYIFDLDGTIADTLESIAYTCNRVLEQYGFSPHPKEAYKTFVGDAVGKLIERALLTAGDIPDQNGMPEHYERVLAAYRELFQDTCTYNVIPYDGMREVLEQLKAEGAHLAVLTNKRHAQAIKVITEIYGEYLFDAVLGEGGTFARKPSPEGALHLAAQFGVPPRQCVYVGDTNTDMKTGLAAGMYTVGVTWGFRPKTELEAFSPNAIINTPKMLLNLPLETKKEGLHT